MTTQERTFEVFIQCLIFYSIGTHLAELEFGDTESNAAFFLWSERIVTAIFTIEYVARWIASGRWSYPSEFMAIVDLVAILPFYVGFFIDLRSLRLIRLLRAFRLFKLTRYNDALQGILNAFHRVRHEFAIIGFGVLLVWWCSALAIFELERERQPEVFGRLTDALWYVLVTVTTVGYGDKVPLTAGGKIVACCTMLAGLTLFGTFISLIGGAYLEEIRRTMTAMDEGKEEARESAANQEDSHSVDDASTGGFDPALVLARMDRGELDSSDRSEIKQLLATACRALLK